MNDEWVGDVMACTVDQARAAAAEADIAAQMARVFEVGHPALLLACALQPESLKSEDMLLELIYLQFDKPRLPRSACFCCAARGQGGLLAGGSWRPGSVAVAQQGWRAAAAGGAARASER